MCVEISGRSPTCRNPHTLRAGRKVLNLNSVVSIPSYPLGAHRLSCSIPLSPFPLLGCHTGPISSPGSETNGNNTRGKGMRDGEDLNKWVTNTPTLADASRTPGWTATGVQVPVTNFLYLQWIRWRWGGGLQHLLYLRTSLNKENPSFLWERQGTHSELQIWRTSPSTPKLFFWC